MFGGGLPGGSPGPNARMTAWGRWIIVIMGLVLTVLVFLAMKYCFDCSEKFRKNPVPVKPRATPVRYHTSIEEVERNWRRMIEQESEKEQNGESRGE